MVAIDQEQREELEAMIRYVHAQIAWQHCIIKYSQATSRVIWLEGEKTNVSKTISVSSSEYS
jgi:hypothetical protein